MVFARWRSPLALGRSNDRRRLDLSVAIVRGSSLGHACWPRGIQPASKILGGSNVAMFAGSCLPVFDVGVLLWDQ